MVNHVTPPGTLLIATPCMKATPAYVIVSNGCSRNPEPKKGTRTCNEEERMGNQYQGVNKSLFIIQ
jgi:hypothetical protein